MPIERITRGRRYTSKPYLRVDGELTPAEQHEMQAALDRVREDETLESKLINASNAAAAQLRRSGLPPDPDDPVYSPAWYAKNKWVSFDWYAIEILKSHLWWAHCWKFEFMEEAGAELMRIGYLIGHVEVLSRHAEDVKAGGSAPKETEEDRARKQLWCDIALDIWTRNPKKAITEVAGIIIKRGAGTNRDRRTIRRVIGHLKPPQKNLANS